LLPTLERPSAGDQLDYQNNEGDDEQQMNESAQRIGANYSEQPQNQQNDKYSPEHKVPFV
jgi:hypothetical protein